MRAEQTGIRPSHHLLVACADGMRVCHPDILPMGEEEEEEEERGEREQKDKECLLHSLSFRERVGVRDGQEVLQRFLGGERLSSFPPLCQCRISEDCTSPPVIRDPFSWIPAKDCGNDGGGVKSVVCSCTLALAERVVCQKGDPPDQVKVHKWFSLMSLGVRNHVHGLPSGREDGHAFVDKRRLWVWGYVSAPVRPAERKDSLMKNMLGRILVGILFLTGTAYGGTVPLHEAARKGDTAEVKRLLEAGADVQIRDADGETALHEAASYGRLDAVTVLLHAGAVVNAKDDNGYTPLHRAAENGHIEIVTRLLQAGAAIEATNKWKQPPLYVAAQAGEAVVVTRLLQAGAQVNAKNKWWNTALHTAAEFGYAETAQVLIEAGAHVNAQNKSGQTPLHVAIVYLNISIRSGGSIEIIDVLLAGGADVQAGNRVGDTPLHEAAEFGHAEIVTRLIEAGADVHTRNTGKDRATPLDRARKSGHGDVVELLRAAGAR